MAEPELADTVFPWQLQQWHRVVSATASERLHHGWVLGGPAGTGKDQFAQRFARLLLCQHDARWRGDDFHTASACGECSGCCLLKAGSHPDLIRVDWAEKSSSIGIDQIRAITAKLALTATTGSLRVAIIHRAHTMTAAAANSLLKFLEEPPLGRVLLLVANQEARLPITVRSRCQRLVFPLPEAAESLPWLQQNGHTDAQAALDHSRGAPLAALGLNRAEVLQATAKMAEQWRRFMAGRGDFVVLCELAAKNGATRECLELFAQWTISDARQLSGQAAPENASEAVARAARRRFYGEVCHILSNSMRLDNPSLKARSVIEGVLADIKITRDKIRAEINQ